MGIVFARYRRSVLGALALAAVAAGGAPAVMAQGDAAAGYPKQAIRMLVGFTPGGGNDIIGRIVAQKLGEKLGQPVVFENRAGAGGMLAAEFVARATPDGYTLLIAPIGTTVFNPVLFSKVPYDADKSFAFVTMVADYPLYLTINAKLPVKNVKELIAHAKANPNQANYASTSGVFQLTNELFKLKTGTAFEMIPFKSSNEMIQGVITGQAMIGFIDPTALMPQYKAGTVRILATTGAKRAADYAEIPTMAEEGVDDVVVSGNTALVAPAGVPAAILKKLETEVNTIVKMPDVIERFKTLAVYPVGGPGEKFAAEAATDRAKWRDVMQKANIPLQ
jgi:tripartite-type tricarboxylate transporter receptor subunit TctC